MDGYTGKLLFIDLTSSRCWIKEYPEYFPRYFIGGKGYAIKLLSDLIPDEADPLGPENIIAICSGPLTGTIAPSMRGCIASKSPLNGMFDDSYFGGHLSQEMKYAGYDAIVIKGKAASPVFIAIDETKVEIRKADNIWGSDTYRTYSLIRKELGDDSYRICCIGPAGENLVRFALVDCDPHRHAGRGGLGAVFGSKNLKGIAIRGMNGIGIDNEEGFMKAVTEAHEGLKDSPGIKEFAENSSVSLLPFSNEFGFLPVRNFQDGTSEKANKLDSRAFADSIWMRHWACAGCPIHCGKMGMIKKGPNKGMICDNVEYETVGLVGSNLEIFSPESTSVVNKACDMLGLDTISFGNVAGFAMEAFAKGIITEEDTGGLKLEFGNMKSVLMLAELIASRDGIGSILAEGVEKASKIINKNSAKFACSIQGLETPAWGPRGSAGMGLAYLSGDRGGCHQRGFPIGYETAGEWPKGKVESGHSIKGKAELLIWEQDMLAALYSLTICEFSRSGISIPTYIKMLNAATGLEYSEDAFYITGRRIWDMIRLFNIKQGWTQKAKVAIPDRFKEELPSGVMKGHRFTDEEISALIEDYNKLRGWSSDGVVTERAISEHGLTELMKPIFDWNEVE